MVSLLQMPGGLCPVFVAASAYAVMHVSRPCAVPLFPSCTNLLPSNSLQLTTPRSAAPQDAACLVLRVRERRSKARRVLAWLVATRSPRVSDLQHATLELQASCRRMTELRTLLWTEVAAPEPQLGPDTSLLRLQMQRRGLACCIRLGSMGSAAGDMGCAARGLVTSHSMLSMHSGMSGLTRGFSARSDASEAAVASAVGLDVLQEIEPEVSWAMLNCGEYAVWLPCLCAD